MKTKTASSPSIVDFTVKFWTYVETNCTVKGQTTTDRAYFGLRTGDAVELPVKLADGTLSVRKTTVDSLWRAFTDLASINADLTTSSVLARNAGLLKSYSLVGKKGSAHEGRSFGTKFWTLTNPKYLETREQGSSRGESLASMLPAL